MPRRAWNAPLVGRTAELATLDEAMNAAADGTPAVVLIAGEAGIGKSRLTAEATRRAMASGWHVLTGGCLDLTDTQVLTHWLQGEAEESPSLPSGEAARGRVYAAYLDVLRTASTGSALALVVEDLHWADRATRDLLSYLIRALTAATARARILLVLTYRSDEFPRGSDVRRWLGELARRPSVTRMVLAPFDQAEVRQQLAALGRFDSLRHGKSFCDQRAIPSTSRS